MTAGQARAGFTGRSGPQPTPDHSPVREALGAWLCTACPLLRAHLGSIGPSLRGWHRGTVVGTATRGGQHGPSGPLPAGRRSDRPMSLGKFLLPQDLEDTQLSDKGEDTRHLSRRNLTKASSWWQVGSCLDLQHTRCMMLVPGDACPSPGPMTFMPHFKDGHIGAQKDEQPPESGQDPPLSLGPRLRQLPLGPGMLRGGAPALWSRERGSGHCPGAASQEVGTDREGGTAPGNRSGGFRRRRWDHSACLDTGCGVAPGG